MKWVAVSISTAVAIIAICVTIYYTTVDPRVLAMSDCTRGMPNSERQVACADAIYGDQ